MTGTHSDDELIDLARSVALEAAKLVREGRSSEVTVSETKSSPTDIVTAVDQAAERLIYDRLTAARPGDGFLGEEGGTADSDSGVRWVVDPIDGTVNFLYGIPQYAVSIAAERDGRTVVGVVVNVANGEVFSAVRGGGAYVDGRPLRVREVVPLAERLVATGFGYEKEQRVRQAAAVARLLPQVRDIRRLGAAALDLCAVGAGRVDAYVEEGVNRWDVAAGGLIATEAGARMESRKGAGGRSCVLVAPSDGFAEFEDLVASCGFLASGSE